MFLRLKIRTRHPEEILRKARKLAPCNYLYLEEGLLYLTYPGEDPDVLLRTLQEKLPQADFEETELVEEPECAPRRFRVGPLVFFSPLRPESPSEGEIYLRADLAFGSGRHPTTLLCLDLLTEIYKQASPLRVLDLGCGSGILSLAAVALGAREVLAVDIDPRACAEAKHNVRQNGLQDHILVVQGSLEVAPEKSFDLVVANLTIGTLQALVSQIPRVLRPGGQILLSGFSPHQKEEIRKRLPEGKELKERLREGWQALLLQF